MNICPFNRSSKPWDRCRNLPSIQSIVFAYFTTLVFTICGCATMNPRMFPDPKAGIDSPRAESFTSESPKAEPTRQHADPVGIIRLSRPAQPIQHTSLPVADSSRINVASFSPAEAREALDLSPAAVYSYSQNPDDAIPELSPSKWELYPDEYLFDGGDRDYPIHYDEFNRLGVETEDTIVEFDDDEGEHHVQPTNRVAIFAPRFASVQSVHGPDARTAIRRLASTHDNSISVSLNTRQKHTMHRENVGSDNVRMRSRASGVDSQVTVKGTAASLQVALQSKLLNAFEEIGFLRTGQFRNSDEARLAFGLQAAAKWSRDLNPAISASIDGLQQTEAQFKPQELVGLEIDHKTKGDLRIVKLADKRTAKPGDVITFTLRYDNLGDRELLNIKIIDNLTPRLEYIDESGESDRPGTIFFEENGEGSLVLRFELDEPLPGKTGGIITFQCRVR